MIRSTEWPTPAPTRRWHLLNRVVIPGPEVTESRLDLATCHSRYGAPNNGLGNTGAAALVSAEKKEERGTSH